jgi:hypothetical protein
MDGAIYSGETLDRIMPDQEIPLDALGYLGGLFEARFYQPHFTTDDPRDEIREAAALYGVDLAMMMSIAKVESDFNPRARTGSYKGLFQLSDYKFKKYGDGSIWVMSPPHVRHRVAAEDGKAAIPATAQQLKGGRLALARTRSGHPKAARRATAS